MQQLQSLKTEKEEMQSKIGRLEGELASLKAQITDLEYQID